MAEAEVPVTTIIIKWDPEKVPTEKVQALIKEWTRLVEEAGGLGRAVVFVRS